MPRLRATLFAPAGGQQRQLGLGAGDVRGGVQRAVAAEQHDPAIGAARSDRLELLEC